MSLQITDRILIKTSYINWGSERMKIEGKADWVMNESLQFALAHATGE